MKRYKAIIFDLFGTLVHFDETRLPLIKFQDEEIRGTSVILFELASKTKNGYSLENFHRNLKEVSSRLKLEKKTLLREISCFARMKTLLNQLQFPENHQTEELAHQMKTRHMKCLKDCVLLPDGHLALLNKLKTFCRLGLLSNFDDAGTGYTILDDFQMESYFHSILFSEEAGWIKPNPRLFNLILARMNVKPSEVLFVGDTPEADIIGPKRSGMDTVWINPAQIPYPENSYRPDFELRRLTELESIVCG